MTQLAPHGPLPTAVVLLVPSFNVACPYVCTFKLSSLLLVLLLVLLLFADNLCFFVHLLLLLFAILNKYVCMNVSICVVTVANVNIQSFIFLITRAS